MLSRKPLIYASTVLASRLINNVFTFYIVKVGLDKYNMNQMWFQLSQTIFAVWNTINDPLFAYMQDTSKGWMRVRRKCILYGALPWVISFMIPWFPWANYDNPENGYISFVQILIALCMFDTFYTFCLLSLCALMTEYGESESERLSLVRYAGVAGIIGSASVFLTDHFSNGLKNYAAFQFVCLILAITALFFFCITGLYANTKYDLEPSRESDWDTRESYWTLTKQIFSNRSFLAFVGMNFLQEIHITYVMNFSKIFSEQMVPDNVADHWIVSKSFLLGILIVLPQIFVLLVGPVIEACGVYNVENWSFYLKIILGLITWFLGPASPQWFMIFLIFDYTLSDGMFTFFSINLSDIADEHQRQYNRDKPIASMVFGSNALCVKPALSIAPMLVAGYIEHYGYSKVKSGQAAVGEVANLQTHIHTFTWMAPVIIGIVQLLIWRNYTIRSKNDLGFWQALKLLRSLI